MLCACNQVSAGEYDRRSRAILWQGKGSGRTAMDLVPCSWRIGLALALLSTGGISPGQAAQPFLRCEFMAGGEAQTRDFHPTLDPYRVQAISFDENFRFKAVVAGGERAIEYIALYTYYIGMRGPVLLHEAKFVAPVLPGSDGAPRPTGAHYLYSPILEREFRYACALHGANR